MEGRLPKSNALVLLDLHICSLKLVNREVTHNNLNLKYLLRDKHIWLRVKAFLALVGSKSALSIFDNPFMQYHIRYLNPRHSILHYLEHNQIMEVLLVCCMQELKEILKERHSKLGNNFVSASINFWTNPHRKEQFGALIINFLADKYSVFVVGKKKEIFMIREIKKSLQKIPLPLSQRILVTMNLSSTFKSSQNPRCVQMYLNRCRDLPVKWLWRVQT